MRKRLLSWLLTLSMVISMVPASIFPALAVDAGNGGVDISTASALDDTAAEITTGGIYTIGATRADVLKVNTTDPVTLVLDDVTIETATAPIELVGGAKVTLVPKDGTTNTLTCNATDLNAANSGKTAGILVPESAALTIDRAVGENGTGKLTVTGGYGSAGIGASGVDGYTETRNNKGGAGGYWGNGGWSPNNGGQGGRNGIDAPAAGSVTINSGVLAVTGGKGGAGIGGGMGAAGETGTAGGPGTYQYIAGYNYSGHFSSGGGGGGAGGNGGRGGNGGTVTINGGTVNVTGGRFTYERYSKVVTVEPAGIGGGSGGIGGIGGLGGANRDAPSGRAAGHGGAGQTGYMNYGGNGGTLTVTGGKVTVTGNKGVGNSGNSVGQFCQQYVHNYQHNIGIGQLGVGGGGGGTAIQPANVQAPATINITASNDCIDFVDYAGATSFAGRPTDKNNIALYKVVLTVKNVLNGTTVPNANVAINVNWGNTVMQYTYGSVSRADGTAILWLPEGEYQLAGSSVQADGVGHIPRNQEKTLTVAANDTTAMDVNIGADLVLGESPNDRKVYDAPVDLKVDAADIDGDITSIRWFREAVSSAEVYSHNPNTQIGEKAFDTGYDACTDANRGSFSLAGITDKNYSTSVDQNGKYWVEAKFGTHGSIVRGIEIKNIFKTFDIQFRSIWQEPIGQGGQQKQIVMQVPESGYGKTLDSQGKEMRQQVGFAWDLDGYDAANPNPDKLLAAPYGGFDKVKFYAQSSQLSYNTATMGTHSFDKNNLSYEITMDATFFQNTDCDEVGGASDPSKYTVYYEPKDSGLTLVTIYGRVQENGVVAADAEPLYTSQRAYSQLITEDNIKASAWAGYKLVGVRINGTPAAFVQDADGNDTDTVALTDIQGNAATNKPKIRTVEFIYEYNMTDVTIHGYLKGTNTKVFDDIKVSAEMGTSFTYPQPVVAGYDNEGSDPDGGTLDAVAKGSEITFYYLHSTGNVKYVAEDADTHEILSSKTVTVKNGGAIENSKDKAAAVLGAIPYYTLNDGEGTLTNAVDGKYNGKDDVTVTYSYTRNKHNLTVIKKDIDSGNEIANAKQVLTDLPAGKTYTFGDTVDPVTGYTAVAALNPTTFDVGDANAEVTFWYRKNDANRYATVTVNSVCAGETFQSYQIPAFKDVALNVTAPTWTGYVLKTGEQNPKTITPTGDAQHDTVTFEYTLDAPRTITVELNNNSNSDTLEFPQGYQTSYIIKKGGSVTIQAPVINGYALVGNSIVTVNYGDAEPANNKVVFNYAAVETANFVKHTVVFTDSAEKIQFYSYNKLVSKSDAATTDYTAESVKNVIAGYKLKDIRMEIDGGQQTTSDTKVTAPNNKNVKIVYRFEEDTSRIVIKKVLSDNTTVADTVLSGYRTGLKNVEVTAPVVDGYALASDQTLTKSISVLKSGDNEITFKYDKVGNVTFTLKEHNDATNQDETIVVRNGEVKKTYDPTQAGNPLNLSADKYTFLASDQADEPFKPNQNHSVTVQDTSTPKNYDVYYTKGTRAVKFVAIDGAKLTQDDFASATETQIKDATIDTRDVNERARIGEMYKASAQSIDRYALNDQITKYYTVEDSADTLYVYFWYKAKSVGTVAVHYHTGLTADNHDTTQLLMSYSMDAVVGEKVIINIPKYLEDGKYKLTDGAETTKTHIVTAGDNVVDINYEPNFVTVNVKTKRSGFADAAEHESHEVIKTDTQGNATGNLTLIPPYRAGYTLVGIDGVNGGGADKFPLSYKDGKLTLTGLAQNTTITYYYNKTTAAEYQYDLTVKYLYNGYPLTDAKTVKVSKDQENSIEVPVFGGYQAKTYQLNDGNAQDVTGKTVSITPTADNGTLVITYNRPDNTIVLPGEDGKIPNPNDKDNVIVKPGDKEPTIDKDTGNVTIPDGSNGTVTRPNPDNTDKKEEIEVPGGTVISPNGTITLPEPKPNGTEIAPNTKIPEGLPENSGYIAITYNANNGTGDVKKEIGKKNELKVKGSLFTGVDGAQFAEWNDNGSGKGTTYAADKIVSANLVLYAVWNTQYKYSATITYKPNDGSSDKDIIQTVGHNTDSKLIATIKSNSYQVSGWTFGGWNKQADGMGASYQSGDKLSLTNGSAETLHAQWYKQDGSSITIPGKDGNPNTAADNVTAKGDGISRNPDTGVITIPNGGAITVTKPDGKQETILLPNGGTLNPDGSYTINQPDGGKIDVDKDGKEEPKDDKGDKKDDAEIVTMSYRSNDGTDKVMNVKAVKGEAVSIIASPFKWAGHTFLNWMGTDKKEYNPADTFTAKEMEFFAQWYKKDDSAGGNGSIELPGKDGAIEAPHDKDNVTVTPGNGGTLEGPNKPNGTVEVKDGDATVTRPDPNDSKFPNGSKEDIKVPAGSTIYPDGTIKLPDGTVIKPEDKYPDEVIPKDYVIVTYEPNGGSGNIVRQMAKTNEATTALDGALFTAPRGKTFDKWVDDNDTSKTYAAGEELTPTKDVTLRAQWKTSEPVPTTYSAEIVFDSNTGDTANQMLTSTTGEIISGKLDAYAFTAPENWTFMGWSTAKAASQNATFYEDGAEVTLKHKDNLKLYAIVYKTDADTKVVTLPGANGEPNDADDVTVTPAEGSTITPGKGYVEAPKDSTIKLPGDKSITVIEGTVKVYPDGSVYVPEGSKVTLPDGTEVDGEVTIDKNGNVDIDKTKPIQKPDGTIILPGEDKKTGTEDDLIVKPNGNKPAGRIDEDGNVTITAPDGADVTIPGNDPADVKVPNGTVITPNGEITLVYTIQYADVSGKQLKTAVLKQLKVGEIETVKAVTIDGYKIKSDETKTITAALSANAKDYIVTFTYEKKATGGNIGGGGSSGGSSGGGSHGGGSSSGGNSNSNNGNTGNNGNNNGSGNNTTKPNDPSQTGVSNWLRTDKHAASMSGYGNGKFGPDDSVTRAQIAQIFYRLLKDQNVKITVNFTDVAEDAWYAKAVNTLGSLGIVSGTGNGKFDPNRAISRAEFCTIVTRFAKVASTVENPFGDIKESDWYYKAVTTAASYGWVTGMNDGRFHPSEVISRAQAATIINRMLGAAADRAYVDKYVSNPYKDISTTHWAYYQIIEASVAHDHGYNAEGVEVWNSLK